MAFAAIVGTNEKICLANAKIEGVVEKADTEKRLNRLR